MSYSFNIRAATKDEAREKVAAELDKVVASQPIHAADSKQAMDAAASFIDVIRDDETQDILVSVSGSVSWTGDSEINSANVSVTAYLTAKQIA